MQAFGSEDFGLAWFGEVPGLAVQGATRFESRGARAAGPSSPAVGRRSSKVDPKFHGGKQFRSLKVSSSGLMHGFVEGLGGFGPL